MSLLTDSIQTIEYMLDLVVETLEATETLQWKVHKFSGTNYAKLFEFLPTVTPPAAIVVYQGSTFSLEPGRPQRAYHDVTVLVLDEDPEAEDGAVNSRTMCMEVLNLLDKKVDGNLLYRIQNIQAIDLGDSGIAPNIACYAIAIQVGDN